ncbi:MAG: RNA polymerase sigma-70 factor [Tannerella sp.]|jgi:RNA polymerase sigma-70 factor (ECF subfamily)|nr:RNA polymerase sigma-70 factor [Tannerella sp.]
MSKVCIDITTLRLLKRGDEKAFEAIFRKCYAKIYHFVLNTLFDTMMAEDITQNVFLSIWEHREDIIPEKDFSAYLYRIAKNLVFRETEKIALSFRYENHFRQMHPDEEDFSTQETIDAHILEEIIYQLIDRLPEARKRIFLMHFKEELSNKEIAEKLSISVKNVEIQVSRSLNYIRKHLKSSSALLAVFL